VAVIALGVIPNKTRVGDMGIDDRISPLPPPSRRAKTPERLEFLDVVVPGPSEADGQAGRPDIDSVEAMMMRTDRTKGFSCRSATRVMR
jgi:hypothetical protein